VGGGEWILDGQKVWTSVAQHSQIGMALCRTDPDAPKHKGITAFLVDMSAPGVEVRPLRQMSGGCDFNEVFLSGVRVPDDHRLGEVNGGWRVALTTLMNERARAADHRRHRGVGHLRLDGAAAGHPGPADPRRHRGDHEEHPGRTGSRAAERTGHRHHLTLPRAAQIRGTS